MKRTFEEALEHRRSYYSIGSSSPVSDEELIRVIHQAVKHRRHSTHNRRESCCCWATSTKNFGIS